MFRTDPLRSPLRAPSTETDAPHATLTIRLLWWWSGVRFAVET